MMKRLLLLLLLCLPLAGCSYDHDPLESMAVTVTDEEIPAPAVADLPVLSESATLWFRFGEEPLLAPESREIGYRQSEGYARRLLEALVQGPSAASTELEGLFPPGTQVRSVTKSGRLMFVTLSRHIMNSFADEPAAWRDQPRWAVEVPLRRELAMQSIAATLTENCDVDAVIILVEQTDPATDSLRLRNGYYTLDGDTTIAPPLARDESLLLSPTRTAEILLQCWQESDYARMYRYVARIDPASGGVRPAESDFVQLMTAQPHLLYAQAAGGSVSADGQRALVSFSGAWLANGAEQPFEALPLTLVREKGVWRIGLTQLTGREAQP